MAKLKRYVAINGEGESVMVWAVDKKDALIKSRKYIIPYKISRFKPLKLKTHVRTSE